MHRAWRVFRPYLLVKDSRLGQVRQSTETPWDMQHLTGKHETKGLAQGAVRAWCHDHLACVARQLSTSVAAAAANASSEGPPKEKLTAIPFKVRESSTITVRCTFITHLSTCTGPDYDQYLGLNRSGAPRHSLQ